MGEPGQIRVQLNGPYVITGDVEVTRRQPVRSEHGEPMTWQTTSHLGHRPTVALCRCGQSGNKPYCDGTHSRVDFDGTETATTTTYDERAKAYEWTGLVVRDDRALCEHAGFCGNRLSNVWEMVGGSGTDDSVTRAQVMHQRGKGKGLVPSRPATTA